MLDNQLKKEQEFLNRVENVFAIYQIDPNGSGKQYMFDDMDYLRNQGISEPDARHYNMVYSRKLLESDTPEGIFGEFNFSRPDDFTGHSLSVSDVIVTKHDGVYESMFVDGIGFAELPNFIEQRQQYIGEELSSEQPDLMYMDEEKAFHFENGYLEIHTTDDGYDYTFYDKEFSEIDGGVYDDPDMPMGKVIEELLEDAGVHGTLEEINHDQLMEYVELVEEEQMKSIPKTPTLTSESYEPDAKLGGMSRAEIEEMVIAQARANLDELMSLDDEVHIIAARVYGSRTREGLYNEDSDIDVVLSYSGTVREDDFFNICHDEDFKPYMGNGIPIDINPISIEKTGTIEEYLANAEKYLDEKEAQLTAKNQILEQQVPLTYYVAECIEFPILGDIYEDLTLDQAVTVYQNIDKSGGQMIKGMGVHIGEETLDLVTGKTMDLDYVNHTQYRDNPEVRKAIEDLTTAMPDIKVIGELQPSINIIKEAKNTEEKVESKPEILPKGERKKSILSALRKHQKKIKEQKKVTQPQEKKSQKKGNMEL